MEVSFPWVSGDRLSVVTGWVALAVLGTFVLDSLVPREGLCLRFFLLFTSAYCKHLLPDSLGPEDTVSWHWP